jgi:hypothetical protein
MALPASMPPEIAEAPASAGERATSSPATLTARRSEVERAIRNEAPIRRERKEGSRRRLRRICPKHAAFCFGGRAAAPMLALVVRWIRHRAAPADCLPTSTRVRAAAPGAARRGSMGWVVRPCQLLRPLCRLRLSWLRMVAQERDYSPDDVKTSTASSSWHGSCRLQITSSFGAWIATLPQYCSAGHFSAHLMPDRPCVVATLAAEAQCPAARTERKRSPR